MGTIERISTHFLDTVVGKTAVGLPVTLFKTDVLGAFAQVGGGVTDADGRVASLNAEVLQPGRFKVVFDTTEYFTRVYGAVFYPQIAIEFLLDGGRPLYHIPVLASTFGYSTYLGS